jgi:hypothetical protein
MVGAGETTLGEPPGRRRLRKQGEPADPSNLTRVMPAEESAR